MLAYDTDVAAVPPCIIFQLAVHRVDPLLPTLRKERFKSLLFEVSPESVVAYILPNTDSARSKNCVDTTFLLSPLANIVAKEIIPLWWYLSIGELYYFFY